MYSHYDDYSLFFLKARLRNKRCFYEHAFCLKCLSECISSQNSHLKTGTVDDEYCCPVKKCNVKTPVRCIAEIRNALINSNEKVFVLCFSPSQNAKYDLQN
ncbi:hypothetical protein MHBO_003312, partial [Bonamia ostreae]